MKGPPFEADLQITLKHHPSYHIGDLAETTLKTALENTPETSLDTTLKVTLKTALKTSRLQDFETTTEVNGSAELVHNRINISLPPPS